MLMDSNHPAMKTPLWKFAAQAQCDILAIQETHFIASHSLQQEHLHCPHPAQEERRTNYRQKLSLLPKS